MRRKKILWLVSWYPNKTDLFDGDFIQRHARAAALYNDIYVIHVAPDEKGIVTGNVKEEIKSQQGLTEHIIYFKKSISFFGRVRAFSKWRRLFKKAVTAYIDKQGHPDLVHVHVPVKAGIIALWVKRNYGIPFIITEHLGIYHDVNELKYSQRSSLFKNYTKKIFAAASRFLTVSKFLGEGVNRLVMKKEFEIVPNVVNSDLFFYGESHHSRFRFIHVSNMVTLKNVKGILDAAKRLQRRNKDFELVMVGNRDNSMQVYAREEGLNDFVVFKGEVSYEQVAAEMQLSDVLILFSEIENSPCVIGETLSCGLPVIATNVGGIPELVNQENGFLLEPGNTEALASAMQKMIDQYDRYNRKKIAEDARAKFSYPVVGKMFDSVYSGLMLENKK